jgi:DNA-binding MarR family transcriptional regulator
MLLHLYVAQAGPRQTVSRLARLSGASKAAALRWMDYLERRDLIRRDAHPSDKRVTFVALSEKAHTSLQTYLSAVSEGD